MPRESGYTDAFLVLSGAFVVAALVGLLIPRVTREVIEKSLVDESKHPELGMVASGTLVGDKSE